MSSSHVVLTPPPLPRRTSARNTRLQLPPRQEDPPIPPRLIGSPLLDRLASSPGVSMQPRALWIDGNEFGTSSTPATSPVGDKNKLKRLSRQAPPPEPRYTSPPPPLPPFATTTSSRHSTHGKSSHAMADLLPSSQSPRQIVT